MPVLIEVALAYLLLSLILGTAFGKWVRHQDRRTALMHRADALRRLTGEE